MCHMSHRKDQDKDAEGRQSAALLFLHSSGRHPEVGKKSEFSFSCSLRVSPSYHCGREGCNFLLHLCVSLCQRGRAFQI